MENMERIDSVEDLERVVKALKESAGGAVRCMVLISMIIMIQLREAIDPAVAKKYAEAEKNGAAMPAASGIIDPDSMELYCYDGGHRMEGRVLNKETHLLMKLALGTKRDAILKAAGVNEEHGLARSKDDKRNSVNTILADPEWRSRSSSWIAQVTHTSVSYVEELRKRADKVAQAQSGEPVGPVKRLVKRGGKEYEMTIKVKPAKDPVDVILGKVVKLAAPLSDADRNRLLSAIVDKFGGDAA